MLNLMLHCGGQTIDRHELANVPTPQPTSTWQPIPHADLLKLVELTLMNSGLPVVNQSHALARDGLRYFGLLQVQSEHQADYSLVIGLRNSHDMSFPAGLVIGSGVFVCDNLAFSGEVNLARKHTRFILRDLPQLVERAIGQQLLQPGILQFEFLQTFGFTRLHPAVLLKPTMECRLADLKSLQHLANRLACIEKPICFLEFVDNLLRRVTTPSSL